MAEQRPQRQVKNKDIPLLTEVRLIEMDVVAMENRIQWERERRRNITQHLSRTPGGGGTARGMDEALASIEELEEKHKALVKKYIRQIRKAEAILNGIASHQMRTLVSLLYLDCYSSGTVQELLGMSRWAFENARETVEQAEDMASVVWHDRYSARG